MKTKFEKALDTTARLIRKSRTIVITSHVNPDADSLCSVIALGLALKKLHKKVFMAIADEVPGQYRGLPGAGLVRRRLPHLQDLAISLDCGNIVQVGKLSRSFLSAKNVLEVDHHIYRRRFGNFQLIDEKSSSVAEITFLLLQKLGVKVDKAIAENLMAAIITETGSFRLPQVNAQTFKICAQLMKSGLNYEKVSRRYYWQESLVRLKLSGLCFARIKEEKGGRLAWSIIRLRDLKKFHGRKEDVDAVADSIRAIKEVRIAVFFREIPKGRLRLSIRSKGRMDIGSLAQRFGGGGHFDVASCVIPNNPRAIRNFLNQARKLLR